MRIDDAVARDLLALINKKCSNIGLPYCTQQRFIDVYQPLIERLLAWITLHHTPLVVALAGSPGSGKSTLAMLLRDILDYYHYSVATLALDDFYLTQQERYQLSQTIHPLLQQRSTPGTHDIDLAINTLCQLLSMKKGQQVYCPRFDKAQDDRMPKSSWYCIKSPPQVIVVEGYCLGVKPQSSSDCAVAINDWELTHDTDGIWRRYVNDAIIHYQSFFQYFDKTIYIEGNDFSKIAANRLKQDQLLTRHQPQYQAMTYDEVVNFLQPFQRVCLLLQQDMQEAADYLIAHDALF